MAGFWSQYWHVVAFYVLVIGGLLAYRNRFEWQGIVGLLRTNWGIEWMQRFGRRNRHWIIPLAHVGIYVSFIAMIGIVAMLFWGLYQLIFVPTAPAVLTPVLPGVKVPGSPIVFPLFETLIALFVVIVIHESAHGIVAAAHDLDVNSSGLLVLGPIFGAFVEPDEEKLPNREHRVQHAIYSAGPWSNVLSAIVFLALVFGYGLAAAPVLGADGFVFERTVPESPAAEAGLPANVQYVGTDLGDTETVVDFIEDIEQKSPGDEMTFITPDEEFTITLAEHPQDPAEPWVGIEGINTYFSLQETNPFLFAAIGFGQSVLYWIFVVSLGLGLANLIPLGPVDGGRMYQLVLHRWVGKKMGDVIWKRTAAALLALVGVLVFVPIIRALIGI